MCDVLSRDGRLIHVKRKARSATLSHLFAQGAVSARTFLEDGTFREGIRDAITSSSPDDLAGWLDLVPGTSTPPAPDAYTVTYLVIANSSKPGTEWLPFFSKLNLMQHARDIQRMGYKIELARAPAH